MADIFMYDAVTVSNIPDTAQACAAYVDGRYVNEAAIRARFPSARIVTITVTGIIGPSICDAEPGDLTSEQAIAWVEESLAAGVWRPCVYADKFHWDSGLYAALEHYGNRIRRWVAHYDGVAVVPVGFDAKQFSTGNFDTSICLPSFFQPPAPPPEPPAHYGWYDVGPFPSQWGPLDERKLVEEYDGARKHPIKYALYLRFYLRPRLRFLADRVYYVAHSELYQGKPSWGKFHRGFRYQGLIRRAQNEQLAN